MKKQRISLKKVLSVFLVFVMTLTMIPAISLMFGEKLTAHAYGTYTKQKDIEYSYSPTTKFILSGVVIHSTVSRSKAEETLRGNKYTPVGSNFNSGIGPTSGYILHGVKYTSDPTKAIKAYAVRDTDDPDTYTGPAYNGKTVTWNIVPGSNLNAGNNGKQLKLYTTNAYEAGPAVTYFAVCSDNDDQTARNEILDNGYTPALDQNGSWQNCNEGNNGAYTYAGYQSSCAVINSADLRTAYSYAKYLYENGGSGTSGLSYALSNAETVLSDLNDGYTTKKQSVIDNYTRALYDAVPAITPETEYSALVGTANMLRYYSFTPATTGSYIFYSCGSGNAQGYIYNKTSSGTGIGSVVASNDDAPGYMKTTLGQNSNQFCMTANLTAGTTYLFMVRLSGTGTGTVKFKVANARNITFNTTGGSANATLALPQGEQIKFSNVRTSSNASFTRTGHSLIAWSANGTGAEEKLCMNTESFTVPSVNTTYYALWNPSNAAALTVNTAYTATISAGSQIIYYQFTPSKTGKYICYGTSSTDTFGILYNANTYPSNATYLSASDNDGRAALGQNSNQFCLDESLTAGTKYLIGVKFNGTGTGSVPFRIEEAYTVTYNANGGAGAPAAQEKYYNKALTLSSVIPTRTGYTFLGWAASSSATDASYQAGSAYNANADINLYAVWQANTYTVTLDNNNAVTAGTAAVTAAYDSDMPSAVMPVKTGYTFGGYYDGENGTGTQYYTADGASARTWDKTSAATLYADWTINTYTVTFKDADGNVIKTETVNYGTTPTAPSIPAKAADETYHYTGAWDADIAPATADTTYTVTYLSYSHSGGTANCVDKAKCSVCGIAYGSVNTNNHKTVVNEAAVAATCTATGLTAGSHCSACNTVLTAQTTVNMLPHSFTTYNSDKNATCLSDGTKTAKCDNCSATDTVTDKNSKLAHDYTGEVRDNGNSTHSFKCVNGCNEYGEAVAHIGMDDYKCDICGYTDTLSQLAAAKAEAVKAIDACINADDTDEIRAVAEKAKTAVAAASTLSDVENAKTAGINAIKNARKAAADDTEVCSKCGTHHNKGFFGKIVCFFRRIINFFSNMFR